MKWPSTIGQFLQISTESTIFIQTTLSLGKPIKEATKLNFQLALRENHQASTREKKNLMKCSSRKYIRRTSSQTLRQTCLEYHRFSTRPHLLSEILDYRC